MKGYHGKFLEVDLTEKKTREFSIAESDFHKFIGGASLAAHLLYDALKPGLDPLSEKSPLVFATGPFTGTAVPMVSRYALAALSPLTGFWGEATSGGRFPFRLKASGFDGILITGKADRLVYLLLDNGKVEIKDASHLKGLDTYQTQELIKKESGSGLGVACIGAAGEKMLRYACVINDQGRAAGRCGLGAVMGSKNLKAVAAGGSKKPEWADDKNLKELAKEARAVINSDLTSKGFSEYGTLMSMDMGLMLGDVPVKYFTRSVFPAERVSGQALRQKYFVDSYACMGCPIGCGREVKGFSETIKSIDGPEYETAGAFGPLCLNFDFDSIVLANHLCNAHGIDTISAGVSIAYAMHLYELGVIKKSDAGMEIKWGDGKAVVKLVEMVLSQEGIGKLLSQGTLAMAKALGRDEGEAAQVKGLEFPMHDPRAFHGMAISYATGPRGACHLKGDYFNVDLAKRIPEFGIKTRDRFSANNDKAVMAAKYQSLKDLYDSLLMCKFSPISVTLIAKILSAITGWGVEPKDILMMGDRSINIKRAINNRLGLTQKDDKLPTICSAVIKEGGISGSKPDMDRMLREYYAHRGWDWETGRPGKEKLIELGLDRAAKDLYD
jgi:aldehyde:ferredoxin oxidoreductase